jgi:antitoxin ParD1/3/4/toxin ParE1/3/4
MMGEIRNAILLLWTVYSYLIVYDPLTKPLEIIRVVHGARDLEVLLAEGSAQ